MDVRCCLPSLTHWGFERRAAVVRCRAVSSTVLGQQITDAELARRVASRGLQGGAAAEEAELCRRFAPRIRLYGLKHLRDEDRARDLVQSVLVAVLEAVRAGRVEDPTRIDRFVLGTCRHLALSVRRRERRAEPTDTSELDLSVLPEESDVLDTGALLRCLAALDDRARTVLQLSFYRDQRAAEVAAALATTAGNVRVVRHRALAQLRRCLDGRAEGAQ